MPNAQAAYIGRFAPSPTGPLHAGSLVAALASWLDARAWNNGHGGRWLVRIEDLDQPRCVAGAAALILQQLQHCSLVADEPPLVQSQRIAIYAAALQGLEAAGRAYPCACSRKEIETVLARAGRARPRHGELVYPGTCRHAMRGAVVRAWRFLVPPAAPAGAAAATGYDVVDWCDRRLGPQHQDVGAAVGDFVLRRADGQFSYQLAVVLDDAAQAVSHVVRGEDLADNTARQILLQRALELPTPQYLHTPLVLGANGEKLSKQNGATALDTRDPLAALNAAASTLGLPRQAGGVADALAAWVGAWRRLYNPRL